MKEATTVLESQFLSNQSDWQKIDAKDLNKVWHEDSDRGLPVFFRNGDEITFGKAVKTIPFKTGTGSTSYIGHIAAQCERFGWFWFPLNIFRRIPLDEERDALFTSDNAFGQKLLVPMRDIQRAEMVSGKTIKVTGVLDLHKPGFDRQANKPDYDNPVRLICYTFVEEK